MINKSIIEAVLSTVSARANQRAENAAYGGEWNDGGASVELAQVEFYRAGMNGVIPQEWQSVYKQMEAEAEKMKDPEYVQYLKLKQKYERR